MSEVETVHTEEPTEEQLEEQAFAGLDNPEPEDPTPTAEGEGEPAPEPEPTPEPEPEPELVQITKEDYERLMSKADKADIDRAFGKLGEINRIVQSIQANTAKGEPVEIKDEDVAEWKAKHSQTYDEDFLDAQLELARLTAGKLSGTRVIQQSPAIDKDQLLAEAEERMARQFEMRLLAREHKDWQKTVQEQGYRNWLVQQGNDYAERISNSWDADEISESLTKYKESQKKATADAEARKKRMAAAVTPKGTGGHAPVSQNSEQDGFDSAFT